MIGGLAEQLSAGLRRHNILETRKRSKHPELGPTAPHNHTDLVHVLAVGVGELLPAVFLDLRVGRLNSLMAVRP